MNLKHVDGCGPARCTVPNLRGDGSYLWICPKCLVVGIEFDQQPRNWIERWWLIIRDALRALVSKPQL